MTADNNSVASLSRPHDASKSVSQAIDQVVASSRPSPVFLGNAPAASARSLTNFFKES
jgi:hypothetical protein